MKVQWGKCFSLSESTSLPSGPLRTSMGSLRFSFHQGSLDLSLDLKANFGINYDDSNKWGHICITNISTRQKQLLGIRHRWSYNLSCVTLTWLPQSLRLTFALCERRWIIWEQGQRWSLTVALFFLFERAQQKVVFKDQIHEWKIILQSQVQNKHYAIGVIITMYADIGLVSRLDTQVRALGCHKGSRSATSLNFPGRPCTLITHKGISWRKKYITITWTSIKSIWNVSLPKFRILLLYSSSTSVLLVSQGTKLVFT